ncbi:hypothetical protein ACLMJK_002783 [Lecanora helva]
MDTMYSFSRFSDSWIDVASQPSSSSLSSAGADDADPHTLRIYYDQHGRRRRRLNRNSALSLGVPVRTLSAAASSQEEYEESESESDRIMTSSNEAVEHIHSEGISPQVPSSASEEASSNNAEEDDDDENATALGIVTTENAFTPQPNAFSHPPESHHTRHTRSAETWASYFPAQRTSPHRKHTRHSYASRSRTSHTPYNVMAPSHTADHDAALRASLSTLLSCAAAARSLPKRETSSTQPALKPQPNRVEPETLRLVPESAIIGDSEPPALPPRPSIRRRESAASLTHSTKGKRKASSSKERHKDPQSKKQRANSPTREKHLHQVAPTLMTWMVSAGVVVLFSAISFSAGYAIGKEVGRFDAGTLDGKDGIVCGKEMSKGLRKLRWGASSVSVIRV